MSYFQTSHATEVTDLSYIGMLNNGNYFSGRNRSSEWRNQISANRYYLWLWTESKPCCGFRTGKLTTYFQCKLSPNQGITQELGPKIALINTTSHIKILGSEKRRKNWHSIPNAKNKFNIKSGKDNNQILISLPHRLSPIYLVKSQESKILELDEPWSLVKN